MQQAGQTQNKQQAEKSKADDDDDDDDVRRRPCAANAGGSVRNAVQHQGVWRTHTEFQSQQRRQRRARRASPPSTTTPPVARRPAPLDSHVECVAKVAHHDDGPHKQAERAQERLGVRRAAGIAVDGVLVAARRTPRTATATITTHQHFRHAHLVRLVLGFVAELGAQQRDERVERGLDAAAAAGGLGRHDRAGARHCERRG